MTMVLIPAEPAVYGDVVRAGDLWTLSVGTLSDGETMQSASRHWKSRSGRNTRDANEITKWLGQVLYDLQLTRLSGTTNNETTGILLQTMQDLVDQGWATQRADFDEVDAAWQHDVPDPAYSRNQVADDAEGDASVEVPWDTADEWDEEDDANSPADSDMTDMHSTADANQSRTPQPAASAPPPGWYAAPDGGGTQQWWTGTVWGPKAP